VIRYGVTAEHTSGEAFSALQCNCWVAVAKLEPGHTSGYTVV
jgi:hypothetical protein